MKKTYKISNLYVTFVPTVHTTLPLRTASQGVSFALYMFAFLFNSLITAHV